MKKTLFVLFTAAMLFVTFACKQPASASDPAKYAGKGAKQDMAAPKMVVIPIDVVKKGGFLTRSIREEIAYKVKQTALAANIPQIETESDPKVNYVDWDLSVGRTEEEALSETLIVKHLKENGVPGAALSSVTFNYSDIEKWFGRELQVGDEFWLGFRCSNQDGKELARMAHHIKVGNPTKLDKVELIYGFDGWYIKATLKYTGTGTAADPYKDSAYATATADFFIGADEKSGSKINEKPINSHVVTDTSGNGKNTVFYCKVPDGKIVEGQPYHIKAHFNDVEFGGQDGVTSFESADVIYAKDADSAWNFQAQKVGATIGTDPQTALAKARGAVELDLADLEVVWNDMADAAMIFAKAEDGKARLVNQVYKVRLAKSEADLKDADPEQYEVKKVTGGKTYKVTFDGLQYGQEYFMRVDYSYDIEKANSKERKTVSSEVVQFKTVNGLVSPLYTFDSGRKIVTPLASIGKYPASLATNAPALNFVSSGGNPSNALKLNSGNKIESAEVKRYKSATLTFDQIFPSAIDKVINLNGAAVANFYAKKVPFLYPGDEDYAMTKGEIVWEFKSGEVLARLVYLPPYITNDQDDLVTAGKWTLTDGRLMLLVCGNESGRNNEGKYDGTLVKLSNVFLTSELESGGAQLGQAAQLQAAVSNVKVKLNAKAGWLAPYKTVITLKAGDIEAKMGNESPTVKVSSLVEQYNGYKNFTLESRVAGLLVDNVQYKVVEGKVTDYTRRVR